MRSGVRFASDRENEPASLRTPALVGTPRAQGVGARVEARDGHGPAGALPPETFRNRWATERLKPGTMRQPEARPRTERTSAAAGWESFGRRRPRRSPKRRPGRRPRTPPEAQSPAIAEDRRASRAAPQADGSTVRLAALKLLSYLAGARRHGWLFGPLFFALRSFVV